MTEQIVHLGHGRTATAGQANFVDPTVARPPRASVPELKLQALRRIKPVYQPPKPEGPVRFVPGPLMAMGDRQCRWPLERDLYCGARTVTGKSWCPKHDGLAHERPRAGGC